MNKQTLTFGLKTLALFALTGGAASLSLIGCVTQADKDSDYSSDGQSAFLVTELDQMGQATGELAAPAAKTAAAITITGELVIDPFAYKADCQCFVRKAHYTGIKGYERTRIDSVKFLDASGAPMDTFKPAEVAKIIHSRNVEKDAGAKDVQVRIDVTVDIMTDAGGKVGVWNGTMTGSFNGQEFKSATLSDVKRPFENGRFRFPEAGTIELTRPVFHYLVEFLGDGKAKVTINNRLNGRIHVLWVDKDYNESDPAQP